MVERVVVNDETPQKLVDEQKTKDAELAQKATESGVDIRSSVVNEETTPNAEASSRPEYIPEKFWDAEKGEANVEALARSYAKLETSKGQQGKAEEAGKSPPVPEETPSPIVAAQTEFEETGALSEETYSALETAGLDKTTVDTYIAGFQAQQDAYLKQAADIVGGQDTLNDVLKWAESLDTGTKESLNKGLSDPSLMENTVRGLHARYLKEADIEPAGILSGTASGISGAYFQTRSEMQAAMSDPRYKTDPGFRQEVADKIQRSDQAGVNLFM